MKMTDIIAQIPPKLRVEIEKNQPIAALLQKGIPLSQIMITDSVFAELFTHMKPWEKQTLQLIVNKFAAQQFNMPTLLNAANSCGMAGAEAVMGLTRLRKKGIIYAIHKHWGENSYCLPLDHLNIWQNMIMKPIKPWEEQEDLQVEKFFDASRYLILNIFWFMNYMEHNEIVLTKKAEIPKRHLLKITKQLQWNEELLLTWRLTNFNTDTYSAAMALTLEFTKLLNLIQWGSQYLTLQTSNVNQWLQLSLDEMNRQLYCIFRDHYRSLSAAEEHFLTKIEALSYKKWYLIEHFIYWLQEYDIILLFSDWMELLEVFGWVEQGVDYKARAVFRFMVPLNESYESKSKTGKFYVQPDFEILVPPDVSFTVCWELTYISEHVHTDHVGVYRLTEQSLKRALANGRTLDTCIQFLTAHSFYGIPDPILSAMKQWANLAVQVLVLPQKSLPSDEAALSFLAERMSNIPIQYEFVLGIPTRNEIYPSWQTIPTHWWKECRTYHASTMKEIVQIALEWQSLLKLRNRNEEWFIVPKQVKEDEEGWSLIGWVQSNLITYSQDEWQAMQLILPGFDEG